MRDTYLQQRQELINNDIVIAHRLMQSEKDLDKKSLSHVFMSIDLIINPDKQTINKLHNINVAYMEKLCILLYIIKLE